MASAPSSTQNDDDREYRAIESALLQTARGRWFLAEHARRSRRVDSQVLEDALTKLQSSLREPPALLDQLKAEIGEIEAALAAALAALGAKPAPTESGQPAPAPHAILRAAEDIHELAWSLQAQAPDVASCEAIARHAARVYAMILAQAVESERLAKTARALTAVRDKIAGVLETLAHESGDRALLPSGAGMAALPPLE
jgi:hypothetical protein